MLIPAFVIILILVSADPSVKRQKMDPLKRHKTDPLSRERRWPRPYFEGCGADASGLQQHHGRSQKETRRLLASGYCIDFRRACVSFHSKCKVLGKHSDTVQHFKGPCRRSFPWNFLGPHREGAPPYAEKIRFRRAGIKKAHAVILC